MDYDNPQFSVGEYNQYNPMLIINIRQPSVNKI